MRLSTVLAVAAALVAAVSSTTARAQLTTSSTTVTYSGWYNVPGYGYSISGRDLNGPTLNAGMVNGQLVEFVSFASATMNGVAMREASLDGSNLQGVDAKGRHYVEGGMAGASFEATLADGTGAQLYIASASRHPDQSRNDVWGYRVWSVSPAGWQPLCGYEDGDARYAIALAGRWDLRQGVAGGGAKIEDAGSFTFACAGSVLAKCVLAGYEPWRRAIECRPGQGCQETTLAAHHQACTRALRADYYGDGTPHTHEGTLIDMFDDWGIRTNQDAWLPEAEWTEQGALCVARSRVADETIPPFGHANCGGFGAGALLVTELQP